MRTRSFCSALVHLRIVCAHWFQFRDQPPIGRGDGEAYRIGFVDVADMSYRALTEATRRIGEGMYRYRTAGVVADAPSPR